MPAATADTLTLPRVDVAAEARPRRVAAVTTAPAGHEGEGFPVRRAFAGLHPSQLDPFIHMDQMGEVEYAPGEPKGTHRGETISTRFIAAVSGMGGSGVHSQSRL